VPAGVAGRGGWLQTCVVGPDQGRAASAGGPDDADRIVDSLAVQGALDSLSTAHREALMLAHGEGLTQTRIAERLSLPLGTVKTRMFHGLRG
jgi:DNA-directed RNA polymerase specialized sigma24 family protein